MSRIFAPTNIQEYGPAQIEAMLFAKGWTAVVFWDGLKQSVACVGAKSEAAALDAARSLVDTCVGVFA